MNKGYYRNSYIYPNYYSTNEERFIGPIFPFLGGALIGYIAGRPQYNYSYPIYPYFPTYYYPNYYRPTTMYSSNNLSNYN